MTAPVDPAGFLSELRALLDRSAPGHAAAPPLPEVLTVDEAARMLRVDRKTVYASIHRGDFPGRRVGAGRRRIVIGRDALLRWLAEHGQ